MNLEDDKKWMQEAIHQAEIAASEGEVPVGAVAVLGDSLIAVAYNKREKTKDPLGHAELLLLRKVAKLQRSWRLEDITVYVTCEPCLMCAGALVQARVKRVVFGCLDPKAGAFGSLYDFSKDERLNHKVEVEGGVLSDECGSLLKIFFKKLRSK